MRKVISYEERFRSAFRALNLQWIEHYFQVEKKDLEQLDHPEECLAGGGEIFFIIVNEKAIGTCAMYKTSATQFELAKMAVDPNFQGQGFGDLLMEHTEAWARARGAKEILILSNTLLGPAIRLYRKHGFEITHLGPHPDYQRCNIELRKDLAEAPLFTRE